DGVRALNGAPGVVLGHSELGLLRRMPADRRWIKQNRRALQCGQARTLRIPLVPADERAKLPGAGVERAEAEVAGSEVKLFVIKRVVGDVHLAVQAAQRAVVVEDGCGVVVNAGGALLEERCHQHDSVLTSGGRKFFGTRAGDRFGQIEEGMIFALAEILSLKKFGQADDLRSA